MKHKKYKAWEDISDMLTREGMADIKEGQVLMFERANLKVMHKTSTRLWVKPVKLLHPDDIEIVDKDSREN